MQATIAALFKRRDIRRQAMRERKVNLPNAHSKLLLPITDRAVQDTQPEAKLQTTESLGEQSTDVFALRGFEATAIEKPRPPLHSVLPCDQQTDQSIFTG